MDYRFLPSQAATLATLRAAYAQAGMQSGKLSASSTYAEMMERNGWQRGNTEGYEMWVGGANSHWPHDWSQRQFHHTMLPSPEPMTIEQFCQKFYPLPEVSPEMVSFSIGNGLFERGLFKDSERMLDYLRNNQERHEVVYNEIVRELMMENLIYGPGNGELNRFATSTSRAR